MQEKASRVGFDWPNVDGVLEKLAEELSELAEARRERQDDPRVREELSDIFFSLVNLARALGIDAETAMREANEKFYRRFAFMEERAGAEGKSLSDLSLDECWNYGSWRRLERDATGPDSVADAHLWWGTYPSDGARTVAPLRRRGYGAARAA